MAVQLDLPSYMEILWDFLHSCTCRPGTLDEPGIFVKIDGARKAVYEIIKLLQNPQQGEVQIVVVPDEDGFPLPNQSTILSSTSNLGMPFDDPELPMLDIFVKCEADNDKTTEDNNDDYNSNDTEEKYEPPFLSVRAVGILAYDGTSLDLPSSLTFKTDEPHSSAAKQLLKIKMERDDGDQGDFADSHDDYAEPVMDEDKKKILRKLMRIFVMLDSFCFDYNCYSWNQ